MTRERQDITEDYYSGNYKEVNVTVYNPDGSLKDLTGSEITYAIFTNDGSVVLVKSSANGTEHIEILTPASDGQCVIKLKAVDTTFINGTFRHQMNVVDTNGYEETVLTGKINIYKAFAKRPRMTSISAYLAGG